MCELELFIYAHLIFKAKMFISYI